MRLDEAREIVINRMVGGMSHSDFDLFNTGRRPVEESDAKTLYHVAYHGRLRSIASGGLKGGSKAAMGRGGYASHSARGTFLTEFKGVSFWYERMKDHANDQSDDLLADGLTPVVLRVKTSDRLVVDEPGTRDAHADAYITDRDIKPGNIQAWTGSRWVAVSSAASQISPEDGLEQDGDGDDVWWQFDDSDPMLPSRG